MELKSQCYLIVLLFGFSTIYSNNPHQSIMRLHSQSPVTAQLFKRVVLPITGLAAISYFYNLPPVYMVSALLLGGMSASQIILDNQNSMST